MCCVDVPRHRAGSTMAFEPYTLMVFVLKVILG